MAMSQVFLLVTVRVRAVYGCNNCPSCACVRACFQPMSERLDVYYEDPSLAGKKANLVQFPPDFEPIPCKPLFFDVAGSMVALPDLSDKIETKKEAQSRGLGGMMKGWLWGSKK